MGEFFEEGLNFSCTKCSRCCTGEPGYVFLSIYDIQKLSAFFNCSDNEFLLSYCRPVTLSTSERVFSLKETPSFECILWNNGCKAYEARPIQCISYPFWPKLLNSEKSWNDEKKLCKGIGNGKKWSYNQILQERDFYEKNAFTYTEAFKKYYPKLSIQEKL